MFKVYSKLKKKKLLHIFFRFKKKSGIKNLTPPNEFLQVSVIGFNEKKIISSHKHLQHDKVIGKRQIQESWVLIKGKAKITYFDTNKKILRNFIMRQGDISITFFGGHKLEIMTKGSILYEYKTGPYKGSSKDLRYFKR
tara:strand:+ start:310 stop:726 length:417 start_codon:yes stop_codon:yes gene_type:complete